MGVRRRAHCATGPFCGRNRYALSDQFQPELPADRHGSPVKRVRGHASIVRVEQTVERSTAGLHAHGHGSLGKTVLFHRGLDLIGEDLLMDRDQSHSILRRRAAKLYALPPELATDLRNSKLPPRFAARLSYKIWPSDCSSSCKPNHNPLSAVVVCAYCPAVGAFAPRRRL